MQSEKNYKTIFYTEEFQTPLGPMLAGATDQGVCLLEFLQQDDASADVAWVQARLQAERVTSYNRHLEDLAQQLRAYFAGECKVFQVPLVMLGTPFQQAAWQALQTIPYGRTCSYQTQALVIGRPKAMRAVGRANGTNRMAIIIPCHRVIGARGDLVGYASGLWRKAYLLELEKKHT